jgi:crotonobetainyl-CoA:carnitine CoA-transferase CaiB-like acyl-CoA transferase
LDALLAGWTRTQDDFELFHKLQAAGVPAGPVQNERDAYNCPQLQARGFFQEIDHPEFGTYSYPGFNIAMAHTPNHIRRHPCLLGEDNDYVYHDLLDVSEEQYRELDEKGHIGMDYPPTAWGQGRD